MRCLGSKMFFSEIVCLRVRGYIFVKFEYSAQKFWGENTQRITVLRKVLHSLNLRICRISAVIWIYFICNSLKIDYLIKLITKEVLLLLILEGKFDQTIIWPLLVYCKWNVFNFNVYIWLHHEYYHLKYVFNNMS